MTRQARKARDGVLQRESTGSRVVQQSRLRLLSVALFFTLCFGSIGGRLIAMMVHAHDTPLPHEIARMDDEEDEVNVNSTEQRISRGDIVDRNGVLLATSLMTASAFADPREITNVQTVAAELAKAVGVPREVLLKRLSGKRHFVWIKRHLIPSEQQAVNNLGIPGVYFLPEEKRVYPFGPEAVHVVGYVGTDNTGLSGIEKTFDSRLTDESENDKPVALSLDMRIQHIVHDETEKAVEQFHALGGAGIVLDIKSGEVLAMVSLPDFNPNFPARATNDERFDRAAEGLYEMGSTFKSFTFAAALNDGVATLKNGYDVSQPLHYANCIIHDAESKKRWLSLPEIYAYSSNIGTAHLFMDMGVAIQKAFLGKIGMLKPLDTELPEHPQPLYPKDWKEINGITIAYGHGISVTPLHLVRGIATLVNGGTLEPITFLKGGNADKDAAPRIISARTSLTMRRLMRMVVKHGTGGKADVAGYRLGGKTGTAEKAQGGGYSRDNKLASFVGVFPIDAPRYVVLVMVDQPHGDKATFGFATGGWIAAPAVQQIVERMAPIMDVRPEFNVPADDADQYWIDTDKKPATPSYPHTLPASYIRPIAYRR